MYRNLKILILGAARSGISVAKLIAKDNNVTITDLNPLNKEDETLLKKLKVNIVITKDQTSLIDSSWDLIIKNPAIMYTSDVYQKCLRLKLRIENELEVAYHYINKNITIIGVTGSNGKTTTTTMIYDLLKKLDQKVILAGNIGIPLSDLIEEVNKNDILLLEISDHQLMDFKDFKTNISVLTNICPTHLDYHGSYEHYKDSKRKIFNNHTSKDLSIINKRDSESLSIIESIKSKIVYFNDNNNYYDENGIYIDKKKILDTSSVRVLGHHNYENILAALLVVREFAFDENIIKDYFKTFNGVEHRLEYVKEVNKVTYYNDSKATNPTSTVTALKVIKKPVHLILGGQERYQDFDELDDYLKNVVRIYAVGMVTERVYKYAKEKNIPCDKCYTLKTAMDNVKKNVKANEVVLLSPASSSQDQYKKFEDRGNEFKSLIS